MNIVHSFPEGDKVIYTINSYYYTPRVAVLQYLNDPSKSDIVEWVDKGKSYVVYDEEKLYKEWGAKVLSNQIFATYLFDSYIFASSESEKTDNGYCYTIDTLSTDVRNIVNDLKVGHLHEWIILFLLEQSRQDWVQWTDEKELEFRILDIESMSAAYIQVNGIHTKCPSYVILLMLSGYCITGVMKKIGRLDYKFDRKWYDCEIKKSGCGRKYFENLIEEIHISRALHPQTTSTKHFNYATFRFGYNYNDFP